ncbi:hypothetical protein [Enterobacter hormaechei]|uniref:hypothetical protein n=1 Tax=Enterobacter hormaechei TaxID=158836 RepID=UPI0027D2751A|nr:hypothetical protein [Enterobacter hormaechei]WMA23132.1 hypothetical protein QPR56_10135 [Enterobacter hormaechei]HBN5788435.1 hypothetical protein [Enterobacter hormaechei]
MDLTPLDSWLRVDTWDTHHPSDQERFYKSVYKLITSNDKPIESQYVKDYILDYKNKFKNQEHVERIAEIYTEKYDVIYSFLFENRITLN